jgi:hypothetical protein
MSEMSEFSGYEKMPSSLKKLYIETEFLRDTLVYFNENNENLLEELSAEERNWIHERVTAEVKKVITIVSRS